MPTMTRSAPPAAAPRASDPPPMTIWTSPPSKAEVVVEPPAMTLKSTSRPFFSKMAASLPTQEGMLEALRLDRAALILMSAPLAAGLVLVAGLAAAVEAGADGTGAAVPPQPASVTIAASRMVRSFMAPDCAMGSPCMRPGAGRRERVRSLAHGCAGFGSHRNCASAACPRAWPRPPPDDRPAVCEPDLRQRRHHRRPDSRHHSGRPDPGLQHLGRAAELRAHAGRGSVLAAALGLHGSLRPAQRPCPGLRHRRLRGGHELRLGHRTELPAAAARLGDLRRRLHRQPAVALRRGR